MGKIFGLSFLFMLVVAVNLGFFVATPEINAGSGAFYGFLAGFGRVLGGIGVSGLLGRRDWTYILINGFYWIVSLAIMGLILGAWR